MNEPRRKVLRQALGLLEEAKSLIEQAGGEEQEYYDNIPESLQASEKGDAAQECCDKLTEIVDYVDQSVDALGEIEGVQQ